MKSNIGVILIIAAIAAVLSVGFALGATKANADLYQSLSVNISRTMKGEEIVQVTTIIKFKDGTPVEIAPFKEIKVE